MQAAALAVLILAPLALAAGGAAEAPLDVLFRPPAQMGPGLDASGATWALVVFGDGDSGLFDAAFPSGAQQSEVTRTRTWTYATDWSTPIEGRESSQSLAPLEAEASAGGAGSLFLQADSITLETAGAETEAVHGLCADQLFTRPERAGLEARFERACPGADPGAAVVARGAMGPLSVRLQATGVRAVEWHGLGVRCGAEGDGCPTGGARDRQAVGPSAKMDAFTYERLEAAGASLDGKATAVRLIVGAPALDLAVDGHVRLPLAQAGEGCACPGINGRTLRSDGAMTLSGVRPADGGLLSARLGGSLESARLDEQAIDPALLLGLGTAAGAAAATALAVVAVRLLPALFTRLTPERALVSPLRRLLLDAVRANPGIHERALARLVERSPSTVRHHVAMLAAQGLVERRRHGKRRLLFDRRPDAPRGAEAALLEPDLRRLDEWRREHPDSPPAAAVRHAVQSWGWSRSTAYHRLARLDAALLVRS